MNSDQRAGDNASLPVSIGGAMRCCLGSLSEAPPEQINDGLVPCRYCKARMEVIDGAWRARWD